MFNVVFFIVKLMPKSVGNLMSGSELNADHVLCVEASICSESYDIIVKLCVASGIQMCAGVTFHFVTRLITLRKRVVGMAR